MMKLQPITTDIRHIPEIQAIAAYLRNMEFKRRLFGGIDTEDVLDQVSDITLRYEAVISSYVAQCRQHSRQAAEWQDALAYTQQENAAMDQYYRELVQWHEGRAAWLQTHNDQLQREAMYLSAQPDPRRLAYRPQY